MKNLTISVKLVALTLFALLLLGAVAAAGLVGSSAQSDAAKVLARTPEAMRGATTADMYHDAVNNAVTQALSTGRPEDVLQASKDVDTAAGNFTTALESTRDAKVSQRLADLTKQPLDASSTTPPRRRAC